MGQRAAGLLAWGWRASCGSSGQVASRFFLLRSWLACCSPAAVGSDVSHTRTAVPLCAALLLCSQPRGANFNLHASRTHLALLCTVSLTPPHSPTPVQVFLLFICWMRKRKSSQQPTGAITTVAPRPQANGQSNGYANGYTNGYANGYSGYQNGAAGAWGYR